jgi:hypothetical protein
LQNSAGTTLLEYLQDHYPEQYNNTVLRTLQRRIKQWRVLEGLGRWQPKTCTNIWAGSDGLNSTNMVIYHLPIL